MNEVITIRTVRYLRGEDVKKILAEKYHTTVDNIKCKGYYSFEVITDEKVNKDMTAKADD